MFLNKIKTETEQKVADAKKIGNFALAFKDNHTNIIAEVKFASPSKGLIRDDLSAVEIADMYIENGASALSVLTEPNYFKGDINYLKQIKEKYPTFPVLRKDFILDEYQLYEAKINGADAALLIMAFLGREKIQKLIKKATEIGLDILLEVHNEDEMQEALKTDAKIIGVNNRNLQTLQISLEMSRNLAKYITQERIFICESGIDNPETIAEMEFLGYKGFLIGSHFMESNNPGKALNEMINQ